MKIKIDNVQVKEKSQSESAKDDGSSKESYGAKLQGAWGVCPITISLKSQFPLSDLKEGMTGLVVTIDNPQTRFTDAVKDEMRELRDDLKRRGVDMTIQVGGTTSGIEKRKPDVMRVEKPAKKPKGSKAIDEIQAALEDDPHIFDRLIDDITQTSTPEEFAAAKDAEVKRLGDEADERLKNVKKERKE